MDEVHSEFIELVPFVHQVGGHSFMLSLDASTVCKALVPRELNLYQTLPEALKKFAPTFYTIINVHTVQDSDGYIKFLAKPPSDYQPKVPAPQKIRLKRSGSFEVSENNHLFVEEGTEGFQNTAMNPWVLKCHQDSDIILSSVARDFIVLENLVHKFRYPCILDLKMGTRQYGDAASLAKKQSKMVKVVSTTSAKLGLRVGGMQVYQVNTKQYLCWNKFYGRKLTVTSFQSALVKFFNNGVRFRREVIPAFIRKLEELGEIVAKQEAIRFYTTSLLLIYEGHDDFQPEGEKSAPLVAEAKLDRHNSLGGSDSDLYKNSSFEEDSESPKTRIRRRRRRTSSAFNLETSVLSDASSNASSNSTIFEDCSNFLEKSLFVQRHSFSSKSDTPEAEPHVDVRMIDFAHSTHRALDDPIVYSGPDRGFLFGLDKLIDLLKMIENDYG